MTLRDAIVQLLTAATGMFAILGGWIAIQGFVRKGSGCRPDHDVLDYLAHGCASCVRGQTCENRMKTAGLNPGTEHTQHESE